MEKKQRDWTAEYEAWLAAKNAGLIKSDPNDPGLGLGFESHPSGGSSSGGYGSSSSAAVDPD